MALTPGCHLGVYEITSLIGEGGMGSVYRALDMGLGRQVAIKVLPDVFANDAERLARFEREAKVLATLNHPHIAAIYGLEKSGGTRALVMELVEGEDLSHRIAHGAIPLDDALSIAKQVAEALGAAHGQGIIHRDLKPANIKVRPDGTVKVLDFGLAKAMEPTGAISASLSLSPTITSPAMTQAGVILGTAAYMSPEQAKARQVDRRADIWAFGVVLFEMLAGVRPFGGEDTVDVLGAVVRLEPLWEAFPKQVPRPIRTLLESCLVKDPRARVADMSTAQFILDNWKSLATTSDGTPSQTSVTASVSRRRLGAAAILALLVGGGVATLLTRAWMRQAPQAHSPIRFAIAPPEDQALGIDNNNRDLAVSSDGTQVVFDTGGQADHHWYVRSLDSLTPLSLGTLPQDAEGPFLSPDNKWVGFSDVVYQPRTLIKVPIGGGPVVPIPIEGIAGIVNIRGATWGPDNTIVFAGGGRNGLIQVPAEGGKAEVLTTPTAGTFHRWPSFLPGGAAVLFTIVPENGDVAAAQIAVLDLKTRAQTVLVSGGSDASYSTSGHLLYGAVGALRAVSFDLDRMTVTGSHETILNELVTKPSGAADFAIATNGTLAYADGPVTASTQLSTLVWVDRNGRSTPILDREGAYRAVRLAPDGKRVAVDSATPPRGDGNRDIWVVDAGLRTETRLTSEPGSDGLPLWTPDGQRIVFSSNRAGSANSLYWVSADGRGTPERLTFAESSQGATSWSPDGRTLAFYDVGKPAIFTIMPGSAPKAFLATPFRTQGAAFSPDGRWVAYFGNETGRDEIYVTSYPEAGGRVLVSSEGGRSPKWSGNGRELFYRNNRKMMVVPVTPGPRIVTGRPQVLFEGNYVMEDLSQGASNYDVSPDGQRFVMMKEASAAAQRSRQLIVAQDWRVNARQLAR